MDANGREWKEQQAAAPKRGCRVAARQSILSGDRYVGSNRRPTNGLLVLLPGDSVSWSNSFHADAGHLAFGDGSVAGATSRNLQQALQASGVPANRWALPLVGP